MEDETSGTPASSKDAHSSESGAQPGSSTHSQAKTPASVAGPASRGESSSSTAKGSGGHEPHSKRRRGLGVVTPNACTECRKKRAKCDGQNPCGRCKAQKDVECIYEIPVRQSKENLRTELEGLRRQQRDSDSVLAALTRPERWEEVLARIRGGHPVEQISEWINKGLPSPRAIPSSSSPTSLPPITAFGSSTGLPVSRVLPPLSIGVGLSSAVAGAQHSPQTQRQDSLQPELRTNGPWNFPSSLAPESARASTHSDAMNWQPDVSSPPQSRVGSWAENVYPADQRMDSMSKFRGLDQVLAPLKEQQSISTPPDTWSKVTRDVTLIQHLLALYFCWEYPTFASLSKEHFLQDFQDGRYRYCSPMLVNAMLALGCRFSTQPKTRANPNDPYTSGDHFFKESQRLFSLETDHHTLTTIQALGIMSIREASCGRDSESWYYAGQSIRLAIEMGLHRLHGEGDEDELAVQSATFWGAFALDHAWSLATGTLPQCSYLAHLPPKPAIIGDIEASLWVPYTDNGAPLQKSCEQPSNVRSVYKCFCELSELVHESLYMLHSPGRPLMARDLLGLYTQYLNWYDRIPEVLRLGHNFTPAVLFAHMYYHFAILLLFRPLIKLRILGSKITPQDVCTQAADAMQGLLRSYSQLYTLQRTPSFVPYFVLTSSIMHLAIGAARTSAASSEDSTPASIEAAVKLDPHITEAINQGISDLSEMAPCHQFAEQALNILRFIAKKWNIDVDVDNGRPPPDDYDKLVSPSTDSLNFFIPNIQSDYFSSEFGSKRSTRFTSQPSAAMNTTGSPKETTQKIQESIENPLFWPFPMQGRPILPRGAGLEAAGFALL